MSLTISINDKYKNVDKFVKSELGDTWHPLIGYSYYEDYDEDGNLTLLTEVDDKLFHIHQNYEEEGDTKTIQCSICGGYDFNVGIGDCFTAIKCKTCEYEVCIHSG